MGEVDRQRISAVGVLEGLRYTYRDGEGWKPPRSESAWREADELHTLLLKRADRLSGVFSGTRDATEHRSSRLSRPTRRSAGPTERSRREGMSAVPDGWN